MKFSHNLLFLVLCLITSLVRGQIQPIDAVEFRVNQTLDGKQRVARNAIHDDGSFVITWQSDEEDIFARRYDADAQPLGDEFQVNQFTTDGQKFPQIAMHSDGSFVITWQNQASEIFARVYDRQGQPLGDQFIVNFEDTNRWNHNPKAVFSAEGHILFIWTKWDVLETLFLRKFDVDGNALSDKVQVNQYDGGDRIATDLAIQPDGDIMVAWYGDLRDVGLNSEVAYRLFDEDLNPLTDEFIINEDDNLEHRLPRIAVAPNGNFMITWQEGDNANDMDIFAKLYGADGNLIVEKFMVSQDINALNQYSDIGVDADGNFALSWFSEENVFLRAYAPDATPLSDAITVSTNSIDVGLGENSNHLPYLAMNASGRILISWEIASELNVDIDVFARRFQIQNLNPNPNNIPREITLSNDRIDEGRPQGTYIGDFSTLDDDAEDTHTYELVNGFGDSGNAFFSINGNQLFSNAVFDHEFIPAYRIRVRSTDNSRGSIERVFTIIVEDVNETPTDMIFVDDPVRENTEDALVGFLLAFDPENDGLIYSIEEGNDLFAIRDDNRVYARTVFNFEERNSYSITVRCTDQGGLFIERTYEIQIEDVNEAPVILELSQSEIEEKAAIGTLIGSFTTQDEDFNDTHTYTLLSGPMEEGNALFAIINDQLLVNHLIRTSQDTSFEILVRSTDQGGLSVEQTFVIHVIDKIEERIYPNPNRGDYQIDLKGFDYQTSTISLYNEYGVKIWDSMISREKDGLVISVRSTLPAGIYILDIQMNNKARLLEKIIIL